MLLHSDLTGEVLAISRILYNSLGPGLPEAAYQKALEFELGDRKVCFAPQVEFLIKWKTRRIGTCYADLVIGSRVIVELKAVDNLIRLHELQTLTYLKVSKLQVGLVVNFGGDRLEFKRLLNPETCGDLRATTH